MRLEIPLKNPTNGPCEAISQPVTESVRFVRQSGCPAKFVIFTLEFQPAPQISGVVVENRLSEEQLPQEFVEAIFEGIEEVAIAGTALGYPLTDLRVTITEAMYHEVDSAAFDFQRMAKQAVETALKKAGTVLIYPG
jgi:elongation factor G